MKQLLVIAIALASVNAFATRARVSALGNAVQLIDTQTVLTNPADMMSMGDYANIESGTTATTTYNSNTEGTVVRSYGNSKLGLTLGHQSTNASAYSTGAATPGLRFAASQAFMTATFGGAGAGAGLATVKGQQNPVNIHYGTKMNDWALAGTLVYSNYNDKKNDEKESSAGIRLGARNEAWDAKLGIGLGNTYENGTEKFSGTSGYSAGIGYKMEDWYFNAYIEAAGFKVEKAGTETAKLDYMSSALAAVKSHKVDGGNIFYGVTLAQDERKFKLVSGAEVKQTALTLPILVGFETEAASWLTLRGSVSQKTLINSSKADVSGTTAQEFAPGANSTVAAIGAGLKFNKLTLDGSLQGLTGDTQTQDLNSNKLLSQVGITYLF